MKEMTFKLLEYNLRREARGVEAARVGIYEDGKLVETLWMSKKDAKREMDAGHLAAANMEINRVILACNHDWKGAGLEADSECPTLYKRIEFKNTEARK